jgi:hypothetical protein
MPFTKQDTRINKNGRPKGVLNKSNEELRSVFASFLTLNLENLQPEFNKLEPKEKLNFIFSIAKLLIPPPPAVQIEQFTPKIRIYHDDIEL